MLAQQFTSIISHRLRPLCHLMAVISVTAPRDPGPSVNCEIATLFRRWLASNCEGCSVWEKLRDFVDRWIKIKLFDPWGELRGLKLTLTF